MKVLYAVLAIATLVSCGSTYNINGTSNVSMMDGQKLYLQVPKDEGNWSKMDSCDVVHGEFSFSGRVDSARWASIFLDQQEIVPVILEGGDIDVKINDSQTSISGTPFNDKLNKFLNAMERFENDRETLQSNRAQNIMSGMTEDQASARFAAAYSKLVQKFDEECVKYVSDNFDNVLGPGFFMSVVSELTTISPDMVMPWVDDIMSKATPKFKSNPFIKDFNDNIQQARNESNGMSSSEDDSNANAQLTPGTNGIPSAPTPNEMAGDSTSGK